MGFSINTYTSDGSTTQFPISFTNGIYHRDNVFVYVEDDVDGGGEQLTRSFTWINDGIIDLDVAAPVNKTITIRREMNRDAPDVDYVDGAILDEGNLDKSYDQMINLIHEVFDGAGVNAGSTSTDLITHDTGTSTVNLEQYLQSLEVGPGDAGETYDTIADMQATAETTVGALIHVLGYGAEGDGGGGMWKRTLASAFVGTPNELTQITVGLYVYIYIDQEGRWKTGRKWGLTTANLDAVITALKAEVGADNAALEVFGGNFNISNTIDIDLRGAGGKGQGELRSTPTILFMQNTTTPIVTLTYTRQIVKGITGTYSAVLDHTTAAIHTTTTAQGVYIPTATTPAFCDVDVEINNAHTGIFFSGSAFGSTIKVNAKQCYAIARGDETLNQTSMDLTLQGTGCFNGIIVPKIVYSTVKAYFDKCGLEPDGGTYVPPSVLPVMVDADTWRGVYMPYSGAENTIAPMIRASAYSTVTGHWHIIHDSNKVWARNYNSGGFRETIDVPNGTQTLREWEQAVFMCDTGSVTVKDLYMNYVLDDGYGAYPTAASTDTPFVYNRFDVPNGTPASDSGVTFDTCNITHKSYNLKDQRSLRVPADLANPDLINYGDLGYDKLTDTIYCDEKWISQTGSSRIFLNQSGFLLKRVVDKGYADKQQEYSSDNFSYSFYKELSNQAANNMVQVRVESQTSSSVMSVVEIEVMDSTANRPANFYNSAKFFVNSTNVLNPTFDTGQHTIEAFNCTLVWGGGRDVFIRRTNGLFAPDILVKVTVTGKQVRWHVNPTDPEDHGKSSLIIEPAAGITTSFVA